MKRECANCEWWTRDGSGEMGNCYGDLPRLAGQSVTRTETRLWPRSHSYDRCPVFEPSEAARAAQGIDR